MALKGHHADISGMTPGSMPSSSTHINQEGVLIKGMKIISQGTFRKKDLYQNFVEELKFPVRDFSLNLADIKAKLQLIKSGVKRSKKLFKIMVRSLFFNTQTLLKKRLKYCDRFNSNSPSWSIFLPNG